jgi:thymidylate synthase
MVAGELIGSFGDVHLYNNHIKYAEEQLERDYYKYKLPKLKLNKAKDMFSYTIDNFVIEDYEAYPNWTGEKKPPIAV